MKKLSEWLWSKLPNSLVSVRYTYEQLQRAWPDINPWGGMQRLPNGSILVCLLKEEAIVNGKVMYREQEHTWLEIHKDASVKGKLKALVHVPGELWHRALSRA